MNRRDEQSLLQAVATHRDRLRHGLLFGSHGTGRPAVSTLFGRLLGSLVVAAIAVAVCVGVSFVMSVLEQQAAERARQEEQQSLQLLDAPAARTTPAAGWAAGSSHPQWTAAFVPATPESAAAPSVGDPASTAHLVPRSADARPPVPSTTLLARPATSAAMPSDGAH